MADRANYIKVAVQNGVTDLNNIRDAYNSFAKGGYLRWKRAVKKHKGIDIDNDDTYDYKGFYSESPSRAWELLKEDRNAHFPDTYKTARHPSFSDGSIYSGVVNKKFNPKGIIGGHWHNDDAYQLSEDQMNNDWDTDRTIDYFSIESRPPQLYAPNGDVMLPSITVTPQSSALNRARQAKKPNTDFRHAQDMNGKQQFGATWLAGVPVIGTDPHTCLNTVTGFYDPNNTVASNVNFVAHPEDYGYKQISQKDAIPGDIIILSNSEGHPNHAVMFDSVSESRSTHNGYLVNPGDTLVNYSNGGRSKDDYRLQGPLSRFDDKNHAGGDFSGPHRYFRFTGKVKNKK